MADTKSSALPALNGAGLTISDKLLLLDVSNTGGTNGGAGGTLSIGSVADLAEGNRRLLANASTAQQGAGFASDTYLTGSSIAIPSGYPIVGSTYKLRFGVTKTAAGTAAPVLTVRIGTAGTTADAAILTFTFGAGTGVADTGFIEVEAAFRTVGSGTSAVLAGLCRLTSNLTTTGLSNAVKALQVVSSGFNSTTANAIIGASWNGGTSASHTVQLVRSELIL